MNNSWIDLSMLAIYMLGLIYIGKRSSRKVHSTGDYFLAGRSMGRMPIALSLAASDMGASVLVGAAGWAYSAGICSAWWNWSAVPALLIISLLIGRFRDFEITTAPELLEKRYNLTARTISALLHTAGLMMMVSSQAVVASYALSELTGISREATLITSTAIIVAYTMSGGFRAVVLTDIVQFLILALAILIMTPIMVIMAGGLEGMRAALPLTHWNVFDHGFQEPLSFVAYCFYIYGTGQFYLQRVFASKNSADARFSYRFTGLSYLVIGTCVALIGMAAHVLFPGIENTDTVIPVAIRQVLPVGISGLVLAALFAATMSSADSMLSSAATLLTVDIYKRLLKRNADDAHYLRFSRWATLAIGMAAVLFGLGFRSIIDVIIFAGTMYSAAVFFPLILGLFWKRGNGPGAVAGIITGSIMCVVSKYMLYGKVEGIFGTISPIFAASLCALGAYIFVSLLTARPEKAKLRYTYTPDSSTDDALVENS